MPQGRKTGSATDLRRKTRIATWNVMTLACTSYQVAIVREAARLNLGITSITEAWIPGSDSCCVEDATILHSGGEQHTNGVALIVRPPFDRALVSWQPISDRLLVAWFAHIDTAISQSWLPMHQPSHPKTATRTISTTSFQPLPSQSNHTTYSPSSVISTPFLAAASVTVTAELLAPTAPGYQTTTLIDY